MTEGAIEAIGAADSLPATPETGLSDAEAAERRRQGLGNVAPPATTRTYVEIIRENVFQFVNNVLFLLGVALAVALIGPRSRWRPMERRGTHCEESP